MVYFGLYAVTFLCGFYDFIRKSKALTIYLMGLLFLVLFFFSGFRYETGWDWGNYTSLINNLPTHYEDLVKFINGSGTSFEIGYIMVNYWIKLAGGNIQWVFALFAFMSVGIFMYALPTYTPYVFVTLLVYLFNIYYLNFSYIRQGFSIVIFFFAIRYIRERKFKQYLFFIVISFLFHSSSVIVLPFYFILDKNIKGKTYAICMLIAFILMKIQWLQIFMDILSGDNFVIQKFLGTAAKFGENGHTGISSRFLEILLVFGFCAWHKPFFKERFEYFNIILNCTFFYLIVYLLFNDLLIFVERIGLIFMIGPTLLYGFVIEKFKEQRARIIVYLFIAAIIFFRGMGFVTGTKSETPGRASDFSPYRNYVVEWLQSAK